MERILSEIKRTVNFVHDNLPVELLATALFVLLGTLSLWTPLKLLSLILFIISGIAHGIYYGSNNHQIFHANSEEPNKEGKVNDLWVHLICSIAGSIALYLLLNRINILDPLWPLKHLKFADFIIFLVALLGYTGLLPMTLWFFANSGEALKQLIKPK